jgi:hypothetical protein
MLPRWPPFVWLLIYVGSVLAVMGTRRFDLLVAGIAVIVVACAVAVWLATRPEPRRPRPRVVPFALGGVAAFYLVAAAVAATDEPEFAVATLVAGAIPLTAVALVLATARRKTRVVRDDLADEAAGDEGAAPGIGFDDERPLGDSPELHDEISAHDLPKSHPGRNVAERQAGGWGGTTRGHRRGGAATAPGTRRETDTARVGADEDDGARVRP